MVKRTQQFVGKLLTNCLSVLDHFVILALKGLKIIFITEFQCSYKVSRFDKILSCGNFLQDNGGPLSIFRILQESNFICLLLT